MQGGVKTEGLCEHHPEHTDECGYVEGTPCDHEHTAECYTDVLTCDLIEDEEITASDSDTGHKHTLDCYGLDCPHGRGEHDEACGYAESHPCEYVCEICKADENIKDSAAEQKPDTAGAVITEFSPLDEAVLNRQAEPGTALADLNLPDELEVSVRFEDETGESDTVTTAMAVVTDWESAPLYDGEAGTYVFTPVVAGQYLVEEGVKAPEITVTVIPVQTNGVTVHITGWEWIDPDEFLNEGVLSLTGVSLDHQADFDTVVSMLPEQISADIEGATEPERINIAGWNCPEYAKDAEGNWPVSGSYTFTADLPEGYALAEGAAKLELEVLIGAANKLQEGGTGELTVTGDSTGYVYSAENRTLTVKNGAVLTISGNTSQDKIVVESGAKADITLDGLSINVSGTNGACAFDMTGATVTLTLAEGSTNTLQSGAERAGLEAPEGATLIINGSGRLTTYSGRYGAGIGGGNGGNGGNITIEDGNISANGHSTEKYECGGAGIGGGLEGNGGHIIIYGGTITAKAGGLVNNGKPGAGIGGGYERGGGTIDISGGVIDARGNAGVGGGYGGDGGKIIISGGNISASGHYGPGIGGKSGGTITISGGTIAAKSGLDSAGIGGSYNGAGGNISISGGDVTATSTSQGAGIGGGSSGAGGNISISGGNVKATGSSLGAGIGGGNGGYCGEITIDGGNVTAIGGKGFSNRRGGAGIGSGGYNNTGKVTINGGIVNAVGGDGWGQELPGVGMDCSQIIINGGNVTANSGSGSNGTGIKGTLSTNIEDKTGNAVIFTNSISDKSGENNWSGVIIEGNSGKVYGSNVTPTEDLTIPNGTTLVIGSGTTLTIDNGVTLTNNGTITVESGGALNIEQGIFNNFGILNGDGTKPGDGSYNNKESILTLETSKENPAYDDTITLTATVTEKTSTNSLRRSITPQTVFFYCDNKEIGSAKVDSSNKTATLSVKLERPIWTTGDHSIMAKYTGSNDQLLPSESAPVTLTVVKADQPPTSIVVNSTEVTYGGAAPTITPVSVKDKADVTYLAVTSNDAHGRISDVAWIDGTTITLNKAGTFYVSAMIMETPYYNEKIVYSDMITVKKAAGSLEISCPSVTYGTEVSTGIVSQMGGGTVTYSYEGRAGTNYGPSETPPTDAGTYKVTGTAAATENYEEATSAPVEFEIKKAAGSLEISCADVTYGTTVSPTVTSKTGDGAVTYSYTGRDGTSYGPSKTSPTNAGTYKVTGTAAATTNHEQATSAPVNFEIKTAAGNLVISCSDVTYGEKVSPSVTSNTSGGTVTYSYEGRDGTDYALSADAPTNAGKYTVTGTAAATANYKEATSASVNFEIKTAAGNLEISCSDVTYGEKVSPTVTSNTSGGTVTYSYEGRDGTDYALSADAPTDAGKYMVMGTAAATENYKEATSAPVNFEIKTAAGNLVISCPTVTYGETVSPSAVTNASGGTVTYSYKGRDGTSYGPSADAPTNAGKYTVTGTAKATKNYEQATSAPVDFEILKAAGATISEVTGSYTGDGSVFTYTIAPIFNAEYSKDNSAWQESNIFTGFSVGNTVTFYARIKEDENRLAGASSNTGTITFIRLEQKSNPDLAYAVSGATGSKEITITPVDGCEYTFDGGSHWDRSNEHVFATDGKPVIGIRYAQTATHEASAGVQQEADLTNREQDAPEAFSLTFTDNGDGTFTAAILPVAGGEYSFDGMNWSSANTKTDCKANTSYTGYVRLAAKDGYNASPAVSDTKTTPRLIAAAPVITPNGGDFRGSQTVTITTAMTGATIYYTVDGSLPTSAGTAYEGPFTLTGYAAVQAIAVKNGYEDSPVTSAVFTRTYSGGGSGDGSGSSSGSVSSGVISSGSSQTNVITPAKPDEPTTGTVATGMPDQNGSVSIPGGQVGIAIENARKAAEKNGQAKSGVAIAVNLSAGVGRATLDRASLDQLIASDVKSFKLNFDGVALTFDLAALKEIAVKTTGTLTFGADKPNGLIGDALTMIGSRPAYNLTVSSLVDGKAVSISNFGIGSVSVAIHYTPAENELTGGLRAVCVDGGRAEWIDRSGYDVNSKAVIFQTNRFFICGVGCKAPAAAD